MKIFLQIIWFILPAGIANMAASVSAVIFPNIIYPVDFGKSFRGKRIFGENKTWRGLIAGIIIGELIFIIQKVFYSFYPSLKSIGFFDYQDSSWLLGILFGFGALFGDLIESFIKRQINISPGKSLFLFDQIDWIIGSLLLVYPFIKLSATALILTLLTGFILHILIKFIGHLIKIDKTPL